MTIDEEAK